MRTGRGRWVRLAHGGVLVLAVAGLLAAGCAARSQRTPERAPAPATADTIVAGADMLAPADLGSGWRVRTVGAKSQPPGWRWALRQCVLYDAADYPAQQHRSAVRYQSFGHGARRQASQLIEGYDAGWGVRSLEDTRRVLETCARYEYSDPKVEFLESHRIVEEGSGGDDALLVESVRIAPPHPTTVRHTALVRMGDLVVTVTGTDLSKEEARRLALLATDRLA
jgi:hypothetical protein